MPEATMDYRVKRRLHVTTNSSDHPRCIRTIQVDYVGSMETVRSDEPKQYKHWKRTKVWDWEAGLEIIPFRDSPWYKHVFEVHKYKGKMTSLTILGFRFIPFLHKLDVREIE